MLTQMSSVGSCCSQKKERSRAAIIENAIALFRERGFEATRVREIADAADVSEATFFNYFPTKDAVLSAWAHAQLYAAFAARAEGGVRSVVRRASLPRMLPISELPPI